MTAAAVTEDAGVETRVVPLAGRNIVIKLPSAGQLAIMAQQVRVVQSGDATKSMRAMGLIMDVMQHLIAESDQDYVIDLMAQAKIDVPDIMALMGAFEKKGASAPAGKARRAR